jgi:hypothetical protein
VICSLPPLFPDQTIYSWCAQAHAYSSTHLWRRTNQLIFGNLRGGLIQDFPQGTQNLSTFLGDEAKPEALTAQHSLWGYYLATQCTTNAKQLLARAVLGAVPSPKMQLGLTASGLGALHPLKYCLHCASEDEQLVGTALWHISHQPPVVALCPRHQVPLCTYSAPKPPIRLPGWVSPGEIAYSQSPFDDSQIEVLLKIGAQARWIQQHEPGALGPDRLGPLYHRALGRANFLTAQHHLKAIELQKFLLRYLQDIRPIDLGLTARPDQTWNSTFISAVQGPLASTHPSKHAILAAALQIDPIPRELAEAPVERGHLTASNSGGDVEDLKAKSCERTSREIFIDLLTNERLSVSAASKLASISTQTGLNWASQANLAPRLRPKKIFHSVRQRGEKLLASGVAIAAVARRLSLSESSVQRILERDPMVKAARREKTRAMKRDIARQSLKRAIGKNRDQKISSVIKACSYTWLHRNDKQWLELELQTLKSNRIDEYQS